MLGDIEEGGGGWQGPFSPGLCGLFAQPGSETDMACQGDLTMAVV